jgi:hypothetical protein
MRLLARRDRHPIPTTPIELRMETFIANGA